MSMDIFKEMDGSQGEEEKPLTLDERIRKSMAGMVAAYQSLSPQTQASIQEVVNETLEGKPGSLVEKLGYIRDSRREADLAHIRAGAVSFVSPSVEEAIREGDKLADSQQSKRWRELLQTTREGRNSQTTLHQLRLPDMAFIQGGKMAAIRQRAEELEAQGLKVLSVGPSVFDNHVNITTRSMTAEESIRHLHERRSFVGVDFGTREDTVLTVLKTRSGLWETILSLGVTRDLPIRANECPFCSHVFPEGHTRPFCPSCHRRRLLVGPAALMSATARQRPAMTPPPIHLDKVKSPMPINKRSTRKVIHRRRR